MGRPKEFDRNQVLDKTIQIFWKKGFAETSLHDIEKGTGVNKSGLYSEFKDKQDLYLSSLQRYITETGVLALLHREPMGWENIEQMLLLGLTCTGRKGCFLANSLREVAILPGQARSMMLEHFAEIRKAVIANIEAATSASNAEMLADIVLTFNVGLSLEQNIASSKSSQQRIGALIGLLKQHAQN